MRPGGPKQPMWWKSSLSTGVIVFGLFVVFVFSVIWFRKPKPKEDPHVRSIANILTADPISDAALKGAINTEAKTAEMFLMNHKTHAGQASRGVKSDGLISVGNERYFFEMKTALPEIDREKFFYEVWLLRPIPYRFFSLGPMTTNELGEFVIEWQGKEEEDYSHYVQVIITRQDVGGSTDPQTHVAEGTFGK